MCHACYTSFMGNPYCFRKMSAGPGVMQSSLIHQHARAGHADVLLVLPRHLWECSIYGSIALLLLALAGGDAFLLAHLLFRSEESTLCAEPEDCRRFLSLFFFFFIHCVFFLQNSRWLHRVWKAVARGAWFDIML